MNAPDLTQRPPRSPRVRLGGFVILARLLDKCRATWAGKHGEYHFNCPLDQLFFEFAGVNADALKEQVAADKGDGELLEWVMTQGPARLPEPTIAAWSVWAENRAPGAVETRAYFADLHAKTAPKRGDVFTWFDLLDVDDYVSFGGQP